MTTLLQELVAMIFSCKIIIRVASHEIVYKIMSLQIRVICNDNIYLDIPGPLQFPDESHDCIGRVGAILFCLFTLLISQLHIIAAESGAYMVRHYQILYGSLPLLQLITHLFQAMSIIRFSILYRSQFQYYPHKFRKEWSTFLLGRQLESAPVPGKPFFSL
jgi:hypothetical protein